MHLRSPTHQSTSYLVLWIDHRANNACKQLSTTCPSSQLCKSSMHIIFSRFVFPSEHRQTSHPKQLDTLRCCRDCSLIDHGDFEMRETGPRPARVQRSAWYHCSAAGNRRRKRRRRRKRVSNLAGLGNSYTCITNDIPLGLLLSTHRLGGHGETWNQFFHQLPGGILS
ncbi:hypothetical protein BGZ63DRAFT_72296 [Mariannaea sp. PMI_226]|nr:hypothetical protein BGZ63DRAFT_72296 [Mariannaea sp. PMI_226]